MYCIGRGYSASSKRLRISETSAFIASSSSSPSIVSSSLVLHGAASMSSDIMLFPLACDDPWEIVIFAENARAVSTNLDAALACKTNLLMMVTVR